MNDLVLDSRAVLATHARSFRWAGAFLPRAHLDDAAIIYAFCRLVDDTADESPDPVAARRDLEQIGDELEGRRSPRPLLAAARAVLRRSEAGLSAARHLLDGVSSDLGLVRIADDAALHRYAYQVAGTVGLMMCPVLGVVERDAFPFAVDLGVGMQITNICRDVREDAARGRVYLPAHRLEALGLGPERLVSAATGGPDLSASERSAVSSVVLAMLDEADRYYLSGELGFPFIPWRARLAIRVAGRVYRGIGARLRRRGGDAWAGRAFVPVAGKIGLTLGALFASAPAPKRHATELHRFLQGFPGCRMES